MIPAPMVYDRGDRAPAATRVTPPTVGSAGTESAGFHGMYGHAPVMRELARRIVRVARTDVSVLVSGESGTGKAMVARALHEESARRQQPFRSLTCSSLSAEQLDAEVGSGVRSGANVLGAGGTLFLDELTDLTAAAQAAALRLLERCEADRAANASQAPIRVIASSHSTLEELVAAGRFREDLFYRLRVVTLTVPPLRERVGDIPLLAAHFLSLFAARHRVPVRRLDDATFALLHQHQWPGNVRELRNVIEGASVLAEGTSISPRDLPASLTTSADATITTSVLNGQNDALSFVEARERAMREFDRAFLGAALARHDGNVARTARALGLHRQSLQKLIARRALRAEGDAGYHPRTA
jgi:DNA-binding NtrC family response regulator